MHARPAARAALFGALTLTLAAAGCDDGLIDPVDPVPRPDFALNVVIPPGVDADPPKPTPCGDTDPNCLSSALGPDKGKQFPLGSDVMKDPAVKDDGVSRDQSGWLGLDSSHASFDYLWLANSEDWGRGTVSKVDSKLVKEVARYFSVTCGSLPGGSKAKCDGTVGCCSADDFARFTARAAAQAEPPHLAVQTNANNPSRTAIDFNGDMFVANRAFGGQSSVTKVANDLDACQDRNGNGVIDSSSDVSGDGQIQTDCNGNGTPDDLADVKATPCTNGKAQEFFGLDDECVLWTTNTNKPDQWGRPLALGAGNVDYGPSDAWAGTYRDGKFFRVDGKSGQTKAVAQGPTNAYGATVDSTGVVWVAIIDDGRLGYFDTSNPKLTGRVRSPAFGINAYGIAMDRDQNVWQGGWTSGNAYRYVPDRSNGFANLGTGYWTVFQNPGSKNGAAGNGRGIAADSRDANSYFVWLARDGGWISRIEASKFPAGKADQIVDATASLAFRVAGSDTIGVGVDVAQNVWGISHSGSVATRAIIDAQGGITAPDIKSAAAAGKTCPAGDRCVLRDNGGSDPQPYTYSDFTGFGLRNFTRPKGTYSVVVPGCMGVVRDTQWYAVVWQADVPVQTSLAVHARTGKTPTPDQTWGPWTKDFPASPADLRAGMPLQPFDMDNYYVQVEFVFTTKDFASTPRLKSFEVAFKCGGIG